MKTGIISVTFRPFTRSEIVRSAKDAELDAVIWGGDVHVPHGDISAAKEAAELCRNVKLDTSIYGSYYRTNGDGFDTVIETADALGSDTIRIWAGTKGSLDMTEDERRFTTETLIKNADTAKAHGKTLAFEYHGGTLTDNADSALRLLREADRDNIRLHWQPNQYRDLDYNIEALNKVAKYVDAVHVFAWVGNGRFPLETQEKEWRMYFDILRERSSCSLAAMEFVPNETKEELLRDADVLRRILK